jgi:tetratricopeptide (TPR) repeat protein
MGERRNISMNRLAFSIVAASFAATALAQHKHGYDTRALGADPLASAEIQLAPVLEGLGEHHHKVTTSSERAQMFFDQGLKLTYAFNHQEALRSFKEAVRLDPDCAMAYWGWAFVLGPNLNLPMGEDAGVQAYRAIQEAVARKGRVTERERLYIEALARRYAREPAADRSALDRAYAGGMAELHRRFPEDNDAAALYADAIMNLSPWNYWTKDGHPRARTPEILSVLEGVLERDPQHEGALHLYIHATEAVVPERGVAAADALTGLAPGAGHLVHMPSHIYMRVGRYADAFEANVNAALADEGYLTACRNQGLYPLTYYPHNVHFLAWAAIFQGRRGEAMNASRKVALQVPADMLGNDWALQQTFLAMPLYTLVRFGDWEAILKEPKPRKDAAYTTGIWHYARGLALVFTDRVAEAKAELEAIEAIENDPRATETFVGYANAKKLLSIAKNVLDGELRARKGDFDSAVARLDRAVRLEDSLMYNEPPNWYYPVRHTLGAVLLDAGRAEEAEVVYWEDLRRNPDNGYSLFGLAASLRAQDRDGEASEIETRFRAAWNAADSELRSSRF